MAITPEQQSIIDFEAEMAKIRENPNHHRIETLRIAKEVLLENARSKPVESRDVTADDIKTFAEKLMTHLS